MPTMAVEIAANRCPPASGVLPTTRCPSTSATLAHAPAGHDALPILSSRSFCPVWQWNKPRTRAARESTAAVQGRGSWQQIVGGSGISHSEAALVATTYATLEHTAIPHARPPAVLGIAPQTRNEWRSHNGRLSFGP